MEEPSARSQLIQVSREGRGTAAGKAPGINEDILHDVARSLPIANHSIHKAKERPLQMAQMVRKGRRLWRLMAGGSVRHDNSRIGVHHGTLPSSTWLLHCAIARRGSAGTGCDAFHSFLVGRAEKQGEDTPARVRTRVIVIEL
jgi:hypothetical protein